MEVQVDSGSEESMAGPPQRGAVVDATVGGSPASTVQDVVNGIGFGASVAVPGGALDLMMLEPGAQDLQIVHGACLQHAVIVVVGDVKWEVQCVPNQSCRGPRWCSCPLGRW